MKVVYRRLLGCGFFVASLVVVAVVAGYIGRNLTGTRPDPRSIGVCGAAAQNAGRRPAPLPVLLRDQPRYGRPRDVQWPGEQAWQRYFGRHFRRAHLALHADPAVGME